MMQAHVVDGLTFHFPENWLVSKYDEWSFYRNQFGRIRSGIKALDLIAVSPDGTVWLIEVKDFRTNPRTKPSDLADEISQKVFDTLAAILPAKANANDLGELAIAQEVAGGKKLRVVLHLEQPTKHSKLFPRAIDPSVLLLKIRRRMKPIDAHPCITETTRMMNCSWHVTG